MAESITLQTSDSNVQQSDVLGRLSFAASNESSGSDARLIGASIYAIAESDFTEISNATSLIFATAASENAQESMRIDSNGYVGINTNSPLYELHVNGIIYGNSIFENGNPVIISDITAASGSDVIENIISLTQAEFNLITPASGTVYIITDQVSSIPLSGSGISNYISKWSDTYTLTNSLIYDNGTNVGIGTSSPSAKLHVLGSGIFASGININNQTINTIASFDNNKNIVSLSTSTYPSLTELSYVKDVTSSIQTQINNKSNLSHTHGNITNSGAIGSTANLPLITTNDGVITTGSFGSTANTFCQGNDSRLSDTRIPTDNTVSTAKIINNNVTYAKIQNISATDKVLGRSSAGSGVVEEITCTSFARSLLDDSDAATARSTLGISSIPSKTIAFFTASDNQPSATAYATLDTRNSILVLDFDDTADAEWAYFIGVVPEGTNLASGVDVRINWMATSATSNNCVWYSSFRPMNFDLDSYASASGATLVQAPSSTNGTPVIGTTTHVSGVLNGLQAGNFFILEIARDGNNALDTMSGDAELISVEVRTVA